MPKKLPETTFKCRLGKPHRPNGNPIIYVPMIETEVHGLKPGDVVEVTLKVLIRSEDEK